MLASCGWRRPAGPVTEGSLGSAEALALRARGARPLEADRVLLSTWALAGQPRRALEAGHRILPLEVDPGLATDVRFELVDAMIDAGRWDDAEDYLERVRGTPDLTPAPTAPAERWPRPRWRWRIATRTAALAFAGGLAHRSADGSAAVEAGGR